MTSSFGIEPNTIIDEYAIARVNYQVARLGRTLRLTHHHKEDLRQGFFLELCEAAHRYDPSKSSRRTFVSRVLSRAASHQARSIRNKRRNGARSPILLSQLQREDHCFDPPAPRSCEPSALDLALDLNLGLSVMSRRQQQLAESLKNKTVAEIARERGQHRCTVHRDVAAIRRKLAALGLAPWS